MGKIKYTLRDSPFFRLRSKSKLAQLLRVSKEKLKVLSNLERGYIYFKKEKKSGGIREISAPIAPLKALQARVGNILSRISTPDYLFAPVSGRSYVDNAASHIGSRSLRLLDIEDFFPSCTRNKVIWFFNKKMECSPDVSVVLANIVTHNGALPQGSPCSPVLAYFCYMDMWDEINTLVRKAHCKLSVYADDLTISGSTIPEAMVWEVKQTLRRHGHRYAAHKERARRDRKAEITGVIVSPKGVTVPNRQRQKLFSIARELRNTSPGEEYRKLELKFRGRMAQIRQVEAGNDSPSAS